MRGVEFGSENFCGGARIAACSMHAALSDMNRIDALIVAEIFTALPLLTSAKHALLYDACYSR